VPMVRTFAPILAGVGEMNFALFMRYNIIGALLWSVGVTLLGFGIGSTVPNAMDFLLPIVLTFMALSFMPLFFLNKGAKASCPLALKSGYLVSDRFKRGSRENVQRRRYETHGKSAWKGNPRNHWRIL